MPRSTNAPVTDAAAGIGAVRHRIGAILVAVWLLLISPWSGVPAMAQQARELRGVWLTTLSGLDWPSSALAGDASRQRAALSDILDNIQRSGLNAVMFQVRSRGNAFYRSSFEPWASELTGRLGGDPGWDPLQYAIDECRKRGLEIHAWVNVFKVWSGGAPPPRSTPPHVVYAHPEWVRKYGTEYWVDPGIPAARSWTVDVLADIAAHYDVDALHLDYARYPEADFDDAATYRAYGNGAPKADWRRENVTALVRDLSIRIRTFRPRMQIGAAPIGIFENIPGAHGWQGFHAVSQDARRWLRDGLVDYVAPQLYWGLKSRGSSIDFEALVRDWKAHAAGRLVYAGMAPYKPEIARWLGEEIDAARRQNADGEIFFRYDFLRDPAAYGGRFRSPAIPPAVEWRDNMRPNPPRRFAVSRDGSAATLTWMPPAPAPDGDTAWRYAVYRSRTVAADPENGELIAVLPGDRLSYTDNAVQPGYSYAVSAFDRTNNESGIAFAGIAGSTPRLLPAPAIALREAHVSNPTDAGEGRILISYTVPFRDMVRLRLLDEDSRETDILIDEIQDPGLYVIGIDRAKLTRPVARYVFEFGTTRTVKAFREE